MAASRNRLGDLHFTQLSVLFPAEGQYPLLAPNKSRLDFPSPAGVCVVMAGAHKEARQTADRLLGMDWARLDQTERLATGANAFAELGRIAVLADDVAALARSIQLVLNAGPQG